MWAFLRDEHNRKVLAWIGGGLVTVATGLWAVFVYLDVQGVATDATPTNCTVTAESSVAACGDITSESITVGDR